MYLFGISMKNTIDTDKLFKIGQEIENEANEITEDLNKTFQLLSLLQSRFNTDNSAKICTALKETNIVNMKKYNDKIYSMKIILNKISDAYNYVDTKFSSKNII